MYPFACIKAARWPLFLPVIIGLSHSLFPFACLKHFLYLYQLLLSCNNNRATVPSHRSPRHQVTSSSLSLSFLCRTLFNDSPFFPFPSSHQLGLCLEVFLSQP